MHRPPWKARSTHPLSSSWRNTWMRSPQHRITGIELYCSDWILWFESETCDECICDSIRRIALTPSRSQWGFKIIVSGVWCYFDTVRERMCWNTNQCFFYFWAKRKKFSPQNFRHPLGGGDFSLKIRCLDAQYKNYFFMLARRRRENFDVFQPI